MRTSRLPMAVRSTRIQSFGWAARLSAAGRFVETHLTTGFARAKKSAKRKMGAIRIVRDRSGKRGAARILVSMAIRKMADARPYFPPKRAKIDGGPSKNILKTTCSHPRPPWRRRKMADVLSKSMGENAGWPFGLRLPSKSPDLSLRDFFP